MALKAFTDNYADNSTEAGFQFTFHCNVCNEGYKSSFVASSTYKKSKFLSGFGKVAGTATQMAGTYKTGMAVHTGTDILGERFHGLQDGERGGGAGVLEIASVDHAAVRPAVLLEAAGGAHVGEAGAHVRGRGERYRARREKSVGVLDVDEVLAAPAGGDPHVARDDALAGLHPCGVEQQRRGPVLAALPEPVQRLGHAVTAVDVLFPRELPGVLQRRRAIERRDG